MEKKRCSNKSLLVKQLNNRRFSALAGLHRGSNKETIPESDLFMDSCKTPHDFCSSTRECMMFALLLEDFNPFSSRAPVFVCWVHPKIHNHLYGLIFL